MRRRPLTLALIGAAVLLTGCGHAAKPAAQQGVLSVVQDDAELLHRTPAQTGRTLDDLKAEGVDWVRVTAGWSVIAPDPRADRKPLHFDATDPGAYPDGAWAALDRLHTLAKKRGLKLDIDIVFWAPRWAVAHPNADRAAANERDTVDAKPYADFAEAVARRYSDAAAFTIWNEPNHTAFLLPQWSKDASGAWQPASPEVYRAMLRAAVPRVKRAAPGALVLIGATSSVGAGRGTNARQRMAPLTFLRALACVDRNLDPDPSLPGCQGTFVPLPGDGWSHHPYSLDAAPDAADPNPDDVRMGDLARLTALLHILAARGRTAHELPLYLTEFGYQTNPPDPTWNIGPGKQARWLSEAEQIARANAAVRSTAQFTLRDLPERPGNDLRTRWRDYQSGLEFADGGRKPSFDAYALPLIVQADGQVWGLVRPGTGTQRVTLERRAAHATTWTTVATLTTRPDGTFTTTTTTPPAAGEDFRLRAGGRTGVAVSATPSG